MTCSGVDDIVKSIFQRSLCTMSHTKHITRNKDHLQARADILHHIREFFWQKGFQEVETPLLVRLPGQEPYLSPIKLSVHSDKKISHDMYLHTSPEYTMKKMLGSGFGNIFSLCKTFRDYESFGGTHNPEFTMLEWYRVGGTMFDLMDDVEELLKVLLAKIEKLEACLPVGKVGGGKRETGNGEPVSGFKRLSMKDLWQQTIGINLDDYLAPSTMFTLCKQRGYNVQDDESYEDLFYRIFLNEIEPTLLEGTYIIHHYPAPMAALAKMSETAQGYAERFEVYINGMEIANAFTELTDADEQFKRLEAEQHLRKQLGKDIFDIDMDFIEALRHIPPCAGIALGIDRLAQVLLGVKNIDDVLVLPMSKM